MRFTFLPSATRELGWKIPMTVVAAALVTFSAVVTFDFVLWDDTLLITSNPDIRGLTIRNIARAFSTYDPELYIPLTFLSYQLDYTVAMLQPWAYHAGNLLLHTANSFLVCVLLYALTGRRLGALLGGLLFAVHPLQTEAVAWASARKDVLSTLFFLLSLLSYLRYREEERRLPYYFSVVLFALSLLAKVVSVTLPVLLLLLDWLERRPMDKKCLTEKIPYFALAVAFGIVALFGKREAATLVTPAMLALLAGKSTLFYLQTFLWPTGLAVVYPLAGTVTADRIDLLLPWVIVLALGGAAILALKRTRVPAFCAAWYFFTLAPTFTNVAKGDEIYFASDRYAYIPLIGILVLIASAEPVWTRAKREIVVPVYATVVALLMYLSVHQAQTWRDSLALFERALAVSPQSLAAHINLSVAYRHVGRLADSEAQLVKAAAIRPHYKILVSRAALALERGQYDASITLLREAAAMAKPKNDPEISYGLGLAFMRSGKMTDAENAYRDALRLEPGHSAARNNLAAVLLEEGKFDQAKEEYLEAVRRDPSFSIGFYNIGLIEEQQGNLAPAIEAYEQALRTATRDDYQTLNHLGPLYAKLKRYDEAVETIRAALLLKTDDPLFLPEALGALKTILQEEPEHAGAREIIRSLVERGVIRQK